MDATWPVWVSSVLPILGLSTLLSGAAIFLLPRTPALFLRLVSALLLPWIVFLALRFLGPQQDITVAMIIALSVACTNSLRLWPLLAGAFLVLLIFLGTLFQGLLSPVGALISLLVGAGSGLLVNWLHSRHHVFQRIVDVFQEEMEYRRQAMHLTVGVTITLFLYFGILHTWLLAFMIPVSFLCVKLVRERRLPFAERILLVFERRHHFEKFPGRGSICFLIGSFLASLLFAPSITLASILILAFGDSITNIAGGYFGKMPLPYNPKKNLEGPAAGALIAAVAASIFVPFPIALGAALLAMFVETLPLRIGPWEVDDNITIPLVAGLVMTILLR